MRAGQPSYVRFFVRAGDDDDIDFFLYRNGSQNDLVATSNNVGAIESVLFYLQPQTAPVRLGAARGRDGGLTAA